jgi:D-sedoheptulose 7-phosphate isomerase
VDRARLLSIADESARLKREFFEARADDVLAAGRILSEALAAGKKLLVFGNGGSAADAQHFAAELVNRFRSDRPGLPAIALTTDTSILTSIANDSDFEQVFSRQVEALAAEGDVAVAISTSGSSANVLRGVEAARGRGARTVGLAGRDGGRLASMVDLCLTVPHRETSRIQEVHGLLIHVFCELIEDSIFPRS